MPQKRHIPNYDGLDSIQNFINTVSNSHNYVLSTSEKIQSDVTATKML